MKNNGILNNQVYIYSGELQWAAASDGGGLILLIRDEYVKSKNYQNIMREKHQLSIGGDLLYKLLAEVIEYINSLLARIRLEDLNLNEDNKPLLFLKRFSKSSEIMEQKIKQLNSLTATNDEELFVLHITGLENKIVFQRQEDGNSRLSLVLPTGYVFNRLISFMDKMTFNDLNHIDKAVRDSFIKQFNTLHQRVGDQKNHIEMKYALELALARSRGLEKENANLLEKVHQLKTLNELYKRSYYSLRNRGTAADQDENVEELSILD